MNYKKDRQQNEINKTIYEQNKFDKKTAIPPPIKTESLKAKNIITELNNLKESSKSRVYHKEKEDRMLEIAYSEDEKWGKKENN